MIVIKNIVLREIHMPLREPFKISSGVETMRRILLLHFKTSDGFETWSECVAGALPNYSSEAIDTARIAIKEWLAPKIVGEKIADPVVVHSLLEQDIRGHNMAKAALEMAVWELAAQMRGLPLATVLGGSRSAIATGISLGIQQSPEKLIEKVAGALAQGYRKAKIKIKPGMDVDFVRAVRAALGDDAPLMVDANNAYTLGDIDILQALDDFNLMMIEQPLAWDDIYEHSVLQHQLRTPICLDESITNVAKAKEMFVSGSGKIVNIKPGRVGGFSQALEIHDFCEQADIPVWCGGMLESGVGRAYNVALASLPNFSLPGDVSPSARYWEQDIVTPEWTMDENGMVNVPLAEPGMGVKVDVDRVEDLTVWSEVLGE